MTAFEPARPLTAPRALRRSKSARLRPPRPRAPSLRKLRRETSQKRVGFAPWRVSIGGFLSQRQAEGRRAAFVASGDSSPPWQVVGSRGKRATTDSLV